MNESIYRSPKWLRNYIDFEINTGQDIKGEPSEKEKQKRIIKDWDDAWKKIYFSNFKKFLEEDYRYKSYIKKFHGFIYNSDKEKVYKDFKGNFEVLKHYQNWIEKEIEKKEEQKRIIKKLEEIYNKLLKDSLINPYKDKIRVETSNNITCFFYTFENGDKFKFCDTKPKATLEYENSIYIIGSDFRSRYINLVNEIIKKSINRDYRSSRSSRSSGNSTSDPKKNTYNELKRKIKLREDELYKMNRNDPNRLNLENELDNYKRAANRIKNKYKFEHLVKYNDYQKVR